MAEIVLKDEDAQKILATAIKNIVDKNSEYFFNTQSYNLSNHVTDMVRKSMELVTREMIGDIILEKDIRSKIKIKISEMLTDDLINELVNKIKISVSNY